jgi:hypothetical protein
MVPTGALLNLEYSVYCISSTNPLTAAAAASVCLLCQICMVGQNHIYTVYVRYFWLGIHQIYCVCIRIYTVLANPTNL